MVAGVTELLPWRLPYADYWPTPCAAGAVLPICRRALMLAEPVLLYAHGRRHRRSIEKQMCLRAAHAASAPQKLYLWREWQATRRECSTDAAFFNSRR